MFISRLLIVVRASIPRIRRAGHGPDADLCTNALKQFMVPAILPPIMATAKAVEQQADRRLELAPGARRPRRRRPGAEGGRRPARPGPARRPRRHPSAGGHRRPEVEGPAQPAQAAEPRDAHAVARGESRAALPPHRSVQDRLRRGDQGDVERLRGALQDPAGRRDDARSDDRHLPSRTCATGRSPLKQVLRLEIKRVIANPVDIQGYLVEFYNLARSVKGATEKDKGALSRDRQLRAAGAARAQRQARRQRPAHRPHLRLAVQLRVRAARERHPPRAAARRVATCASASTACCTRSTRSRRR